MSEIENENPIHELADEQCWDLLHQQEFGRLAFHLVGEVHIAPVNYAVDPERRIIFKTSEGSKLLGITMNQDVAFEVDQILPDEHATSVIVRGRAHQLEGKDRYVVEQLPLRPWINTPKFQVVAITVDEISGRRFDLSRPWTHMRPEQD
jgi:hypothetical protein